VKGVERQGRMREGRGGGGMQDGRTGGEWKASVGYGVMGEREGVGNGDGRGGKW